MSFICKTLALSVILFSLTSCQKKDDNKMTLDQIYDENRMEGHQQTMDNMRDRFTLTQGFGTQKPYAPILTMPKTIKVWVPDRYLAKDDALSQGHWVHVKLYDGDWAIKNSNPTTPYGLENLPKIETKEVEYDANVVHEVMEDKQARASGMEYPNYGVPVSFKDENERKEKPKEGKRKEGDNEQFNAVYK